MSGGPGDLRAAVCRARINDDMLDIRILLGRHALQIERQKLRLIE